MAITAAIEITQGASPAAFIVEDTTVNENSETYTNRTLTILDSQGNPLTGYTNPISFFPFASYPDNKITISGLTQDMALSVLMTLTPTTPVGGSTYAITEEVATNRYLEQGVYNIQQARFLTNDLAGLPDKEAQYNSIDILVEQSNSQTAVAYGSLVGSQAALNRGQNIINSQLI